MQNLLSAVNIHTSIYYHYTALLIPFIFYSTINGLSRLLKYRFIYNKQKALKISIFTVVIVSGVYLAGPQFYLLEYLSLYRVDEAAMQKDRLVKMVPNDASVIATFQFLPKLASRQEIYSMHFISRGLKMLTNERYEAPMSLEYALIDFNEPLLISNFFRENSPNNIYSFLKDGNWRVLERVDDIVLFKKDYPEGEELFELVNQNSYNIQNRIDINIGDRIALLGYDYNAYLSEDRMLDLSYYWRLMDKIERPIGLLIYFLDGAGNIVFTKSHSIGYRLFNMEHKFIKENHKIFIPHNIKKGVYKVRLGFFYLDNNSLLPILDKDLIDKTGRIILEDILI